MYMHLGEDTVVNVKNVITIIDLENATVSKITNDFLRTQEEEGFVVNVSTELPKSAVVCEIDGKSVVYISQISATTLQKRAGRSTSGEIDF